MKVTEEGHSLDAKRILSTDIYIYIVSTSKDLPGMWEGGEGNGGERRGEESRK